MKGKADVTAKLTETLKNSLPYQPPKFSLSDPLCIFLMIERRQEKGGTDCSCENFVFQLSFGGVLTCQKSHKSVSLSLLLLFQSGIHLESFLGNCSERNITQKGTHNFWYQDNKRASWCISKETEADSCLFVLLVYPLFCLEMLRAHKVFQCL